MHGRIDLKFRHPAEAIVWRYLQGQDHVLLRHNYHIRICEIDLITATPDRLLHCIEVKAWQNSELVHPLQSISRKKQAGWRQAAQFFIMEAAAAGAHLQTVPALRDQSRGLDLSELSEFSVVFDLILLDAQSEMQVFADLLE